MEVKPFLEVPAEFAHSEVEGDQTLESWRREHRMYFNGVLAARGEKFLEASFVVKESFELKHPKM